MFCEMQSIDKETGKIVCLAHLIDGQVFDCPYESERTREEVPYPCSDFRPKKKI